MDRSTLSLWQQQKLHGVRSLIVLVQVWDSQEIVRGSIQGAWGGGLSGIKLSRESPLLVISSASARFTKIGFWKFPTGLDLVKWIN